MNEQFFEQEYSEKEIMVFDGIQRLICSGTDVRKLRTTDIAQEIGIGKGTLYLYFDSKDEMVVKTLLYTLQSHLHEISDAMDKATTFKDKVFAVMGRLREWHNETNCMTIQTLLSIKDTVDYGIVQRFCEDNIAFVKEFIQHKVFQLTELGRSEGIISKNIDDEYIMQAFMSVVYGYGSSLVLFEWNNSDENAYKMLIRLLS